MSLKKFLLESRTLTAIAIGAGTVFIRNLNLTEMRSVQDMVARMDHDPEKGLKLVKHLVALTVCDEAGEPLFAGEHDEDLDKVGMDVLLKLSEESTRVNSLQGKASAPPSGSS